MPFDWNGYSFYIHKQLGYSAFLTYEKSALKRSGFVDFPDYYSTPNWQKNDFTIPAQNIAFVAELLIKDPVERVGEWSLEYPDDVSISLERGGESYVIAKGERVTLKNGAELSFSKVSVWVNYVIYYNPVGAALGYLGIAGFLTLLWHFLPGFFKTIR